MVLSELSLSGLGCIFLFLIKDNTRFDTCKTVNANQCISDQYNSRINSHQLGIGITITMK